MRAFVWISLFMICTLSCRKEAGNDKLECQQLKQAVMSNNLAQVKQQVEELLFSYQNFLSGQTGPDVLGKLVEYLNACSQMEATLLCFECIQTLPAQSEVRITISHNGGILVKILDISRNQDEHWVLVNMHD